jgi:hypothetical protein
MIIGQLTGAVNKHYTGNRLTEVNQKTGALKKPNIHIDNNLYFRRIEVSQISLSLMRQALARR